jgi:hypothetical protein
MEVLIQPQFIDAETCAELNAWVDEGVTKQWLGKGVHNGAQGYEKRLTTRLYPDKFEYPEVVYNVFNQISNRFGLHDAPKSVAGKGKDGVVVSCTFAGGDVYAHTDPMESPDLHVLRCNIMTRSADAGGKLYVNNNQIDIEVGDLHCYLASALPHYVTEVEGNTSRVLWMFGYQVTPERYAQIKVA